MRIVMITAGIDDLVRQFHTMPASPIAIIELDDWSVSKRIKHWVRSVLGLVMKRRFDSVKSYCRKHDLHYFAVDRHNKAEIETRLREVSAGMVITYRCPIVPTRYLQSLENGSINLHSSLLPAFRGGDPLFWQLIHGVKETGVTVHRLVDEVDAGPILKQVKVRRPRKVSEQALARLLNVEIGFAALCDTVQAVRDDAVESVVQPAQVDAVKAPNGERGMWRELADQHGLDTLGREDLEYFLGLRGE